MMRRSAWARIAGYLVLAGGTLGLGCSSHPSSPQPDTHAFSIPVDKLALFSTYASDDMASLCQQRGGGCQHDMLPPDAFLAALRKSKNGEDVLVSSSQTADYELLIANLGRTPSRPWWQKLLSDAPAAREQFGEFTLSWRGVELASRVVHSTFTENEGDTAMASHLVAKWWRQAEDEGMFSPAYLYRQLDASNYQQDLQVPAHIDSFRHAVTQLYPDPLEGIISRYSHPQYADALLDISVYPITQVLTMSTREMLDKELANDALQATQVANARALTLSYLHETQDTLATSAAGKGRQLAMQASSSTQDTIYATIYVFRLEDKIVKFTTTMPPDFSDDLVTRALPDIRVPAESRLMARLRANSAAQ